MVQSTEFLYRRKFFVGYEAEGGNVERYFAKLEEIRLLDRQDPNTRIITFKYPLTDRRKFIRDQNDLENMLLEGNDYLFVHVVFTGKSWV